MCVVHAHSAQTALFTLGFTFLSSFSLVFATGRYWEGVGGLANLACGLTEKSIIDSRREKEREMERGRKKREKEGEREGEMERGKERVGKGV